MGDLIVLGLSAENLRRLALDQPISFDGEVLGLPGCWFLIFSEVDEMAMERKLIEAGVKIPQ